MKNNPGDRIGALMSADAATKIVELLGYGIYEGMEVPPEDVGGFNIGLPNPKLKLDNGAVVWGCECWWGPEDEFKAHVVEYEKAGWAIKNVSIDEQRAADEGAKK